MAVQKIAAVAHHSMIANTRRSWLGVFSKLQDWAQAIQARFHESLMIERLEQIYDFDTLPREAGEEWQIGVPQ